MELPTLEDLLHIIERISNNTTFVALLQNLAKIDIQHFTSAEQKRDVLIGLAILEIELIEKENKESWNPLSRVEDNLDYLIIKNSILNINLQNPLADDERAIFLHTLYKYVDQADHIPSIENQKITRGNWRRKEGLLKDIHLIRRKVIERDEARVNCLLDSTPVFSALKQYILELGQKYTAAKQNSFWGANTERKKLINFINFMEETCDDFYTDINNKDMLVQSIAMQMSLLMVVHLQIKQEYTWLRPDGGMFNHGSELYKFCKNIRNLDAIATTDKIDLLRALSTHINFNLKKNPEYLKRKVSQQFTEKDLEEYYLKVNSLLQSLETRQHTPSKVQTLVATGTSHLVQLGVTTVALTRFMSFAPSIASLAGPGGMAIVMVGGFFFSYIGGHTVGKKILDMMGKGAVEWSVGKVSQLVGDKFAGLAATPFIGEKKNINRLGDDENRLRQWINVLLELPEDTFTKEKQIQLHKVIGLTADANSQFMVDTASLKVGIR